MNLDSTQKHRYAHLGLPDENFSEKPECQKGPEKRPNLLFKARKKPNIVCGIAIPWSQ